MQSVIPVVRFRDSASNCRIVPLQLMIRQRDGPELQYLNCHTASKNHQGMRFLLTINR